MKPYQNPYRILYLHFTGHFCGAENSLLHLVTRLDKSKFQPFFLCPGEGEFPERLRANAVTITPHSFGKFKQVSILFRSFMKIVKTVRLNQIALIHSNCPRTNLLAGLVGRWMQIPVIWHARCMLEPHMIDVDRIAGWLPNRIICNSDAVRRRFGRGFSSKKALTIINGVDLSEFNQQLAIPSIRKKLGIPEDAKVVGITGRLSADKGQDTLIDAAALIKKSLPDLWLLFVGGHVFNSDRWVPDYLKRKSQELGIADRVIFTGFRRDVYDLYAAMDIFVLGTENEACGRVIFEAMAMGKPVVGTDSGGTPEIVQNGHTGFLYPYGDAAELADRLVKLFSNPIMIKTMGLSGKRRVERYFTIDKNVAKTQQEYLALIEGNDADRS